MIILLVSEFYSPALGGLEIHVAALASELSARGHEVHVATLGRDASQTREGNVTVHRLRGLGSRMTWLYRDDSRPFHFPISDPEVRRGLKRVLRQVKPDVIHAHNWMAASVPRDGTPLVLTAHDYAWICPKRSLLRPDNTVCAGPGPLRCTPCSSPQYGVAKAVFVDAATRVGRATVKPDVHLAVSEAVASAIEPFTARRPTVVPNFVPSDLLDWPVLPVTDLPETTFVLFAGAASPHKGIDVLLHAWEVDPPCELVIAALGQLESPLPSSVRVLHLAREEMPSAWRRASIAVVPSIWADPCPTVALEAMALGTPVVASAVGGLVDIIDDGVNGLLVPPGDAAALRQAVSELVADPQRRSDMGAAGLRKAASYSVGVVAATLEQIYESRLRRPVSK